MKPSKPDIESLLLEIQGEMIAVNVDEEFRRGIDKDIELAMESFKGKNILSVLNCLTVIVGKLHTYILSSGCHSSVLEKLLINIHRLQQILIRLPVCVMGPTGATGATGATGPAGPVGPGGTMTAITSACSATGFPVSPKTPSKPRPGQFDGSSHTITYCNSSRYN